MGNPPPPPEKELMWSPLYDMQMCIASVLARTLSCQNIYSEDIADQKRNEAAASLQRSVWMQNTLTVVNVLTPAKSFSN